ncbi:hypothetical protein EDI_249210 [Entamoeba dispar SAW760]|uniref:MHD domain-containing protein n=1 Tax=Entamoeba dispar (strain ATCC PRA-260 / SAW760) TaxID=370354 RepID=B0E972_ENTDS|nr:uncharacterized protein EDI_249210 [Entamoeba dispar SAW760]EDR28901.1 hypothetical protein EDI_249210 [Entamoeba dispar SAW760]|eukprot:EDR28901.1 hypothetical protein EDI_249210 [Entamoeba dispar SAW760]
MLLSFSVFNSKGCRLYHLQTKGSERKQLLEFIIAEAILAKEKVISPMRWKGDTAYFMFVGGCWCIIITDEKIGIDSMILHYTIQAIEEVFPISELSIIKNVNLLESIVRDCIGDGILHSVNYFDILRSVQPPQRVEMIPELLEVQHPFHRKEYQEGITFGLKQREWNNDHIVNGLSKTIFERTEPSYECLDKYNTLPIDKTMFEPEKIFLIQQEEINVTFKSNGEIESSTIRGGLKSTVYSVGVKSIQFAIDSIDFQSNQQTINQQLEGTKDTGVLLWQNPYGTIPILSYQGDVKTYPLLLRGHTVIDKHSLTIYITYSLIGQTYLHSFCFHLPQQIKSIETNPPNYTTIGSTLFLYLYKKNINNKKQEGSLQITLKYSNETQPHKSDIPFGWFDFKCSFFYKHIRTANYYTKKCFRSSSRTTNIM